MVNTTTEGRLAKMGHNLTLIVEDWEGTLTLGAQASESSIQMRANLHSLRVKESRGGAKPAAPGDDKKIEKNAAGAFTDPELRFESDEVRGDWQSGEVVGRLTINGQTQEQAFTVTAVEDGFRLAGTILQTRFGITPFSTMMGQLKLADEVGVEVTARI